MDTAHTHPIGRGRIATGFTSGAAGALIGVLATLTFVDGSTADADTERVPSVGSASTTVPYSADTAERQQHPPHVPVRFPCRADAASRWQNPNVDVADLSRSADTVEHWVTPEFAVADLPYSADTAERLLCAP
jgi:hypothetical protein